MTVSIIQIVLGWVLFSLGFYNLYMVKLESFRTECMAQKTDESLPETKTQTTGEIIASEEYHLGEGANLLFMVKGTNNRSYYFYSIDAYKKWRKELLNGEVK